MPEAFAASGGLCRKILSNASLTQFGESGFAPLPLLPDEAAKSPPNPRVECGKHRRCFAVTEIATPARQITGKLFDHPVNAHTTVAFRELADTLLKAGNRFRRDAPFWLFAAGEAEAQELTIPRSANLALRLVDLQLELRCDESRPPLGHPYSP